MTGGQAFAVAGPSTWNSLPKRDPSISISVFGQIFLFSEYKCIQRIRGLAMMRYINLHFILHYYYYYYYYHHQQQQHRH